MTRRQDAQRPTLRLYQVNYREWGPPPLVVAMTPQQAVMLANGYRDDAGDRGEALAVDVTGEFEALSDKAREHMAALLNLGRSGIVEYDEDAGWLWLEPSGAAAAWQATSGGSSTLH